MSKHRPWWKPNLFALSNALSSSLSLLPPLFIPISSPSLHSPPPSLFPYLSPSLPSQCCIQQMMYYEMNVREITVLFLITLVLVSLHLRNNNHQTPDPVIARHDVSVFHFFSAYTDGCKYVSAGAASTHIQSNLYFWVKKTAERLITGTSNNQSFYMEKAEK